MDQHSVAVTFTSGYQVTCDGASLTKQSAFRLSVGNGIGSQAKVKRFSNILDTKKAECIDNADTWLHSSLNIHFDTVPII